MPSTKSYLMTVRRWGRLCTGKIDLKSFIGSSNTFSFLLFIAGKLLQNLSSWLHRWWVSCYCRLNCSFTSISVSLCVSRRTLLSSLLLSFWSSRSREGEGGVPEEAHRGPAGEGAGGQRPEQHWEIFCRPFQETGEVQGRCAGLQKGWRAWAWAPFSHHSSMTPVAKIRTPLTVTWFLPFTLEWRDSKSLRSGLSGQDQEGGAALPDPQSARRREN